MADNNRDREKKRPDNADCQDPTEVPPRVDPPIRSAKDCDPEITPPEKDVFIEPDVCPPLTEEALVVPTPLTIGNDEQTATCPTTDQPGDVGAPVVVDADTFTDFFNFGSIEGINGNQLTFLSNLSAGNRTTLADPTTTVAVIESITHLSTAQATFINTEVIALKANVDAIALASAESQITCVFENAIQSATCEDGGYPAGAYTNITVPAGEEDNVNNPSAVSAGDHTSAVSQAEADAIAADVAISALLCYYGNDEVTVDCLDIGFGEAVPNDVAEVSYDGRWRVGSVTIAADTVFSGVDRTEATALATAIAQDSLVCFYVNDEVSTSCTAIGKTGTAGSAGDAETGQPGNSITVPEGFVQSPISTATANTAASTLATSLLDCYWENTQQCHTCANVDVDDPDDPAGPDITLTPLEAGPICEEAGAIRSYVSQVDANAQALTSAEAQLLCTYCNPEIAPKCVPPGYAGAIPVPADEPDSTWSQSATRGVAANTFCTSIPQDVINIATSLANVPADVAAADDCCYGNLEVTAQCAVGVDATKSSAPSTIPQDTIIICDSDAVAAGWGGTTQDYATSLAQDMADASLLCVWTNAEQTVTCTAAECDLFADNAVSTYTVDAGIITSFTSQVEADEIAVVIGEANLLCLYASKCTFIATQTLTYDTPPTPTEAAEILQEVWDFLAAAQAAGDYVTHAEYITALETAATNAGVATTITLSGAEACGENPLAVSSCSEQVDNPCSYASVGPVSLDAKATESSISVAAATEIAAVMLRGDQVCIQAPQANGGGGAGADGADGAAGAAGAAGNDGTTNNCAQDCYGFYS